MWVLVSEVCFWVGVREQTRTISMPSTEKTMKLCSIELQRRKHVRWMSLQPSLETQSTTHTLCVRLLGCLYITRTVTSWFTSWVSILALTISSCATKLGQHFQVSVPVSSSVKYAYLMVLTNCCCCCHRCYFCYYPESLDHLVGLSRSFLVVMEKLRESL